MNPYSDETLNLMYHLLFCDRVELFKTNFSGEIQEPWATIFKEPADYSALRKIADDSSMESRVRMLAFNTLRIGGQEIPPKIHLGTILEVPVRGGLDTLAIFTDGTARYINHSGKMAIVEGSPTQFQEELSRVIKASQVIVDIIGPWDKSRLPPPALGTFRMSFLVSDGLYFGQGPLDQLMNDPMAAPLIQAATILIQKLTSETIKKKS
jgi:hypothetical protein